MNRRQKARKLRRAQAHGRSTATIIRERIGVDLTPQQAAEVAAFVESKPTKRFEPSTPDIMTTTRRRSRLRPLHRHTGPTPERAKVCENTLPLALMQQDLDEAVAGAKRAKKTATLIRMMDRKGYVPKPGVSPTPSKTTIADWDYKEN